MTKEEAEDYIKKLESFEKNINSDDDDDIDLDFLNELDGLLEKLNTELTSTKTQKKEYTNEEFDFEFNVNVRVKKLHENAVIPSYSKVGDAGMDLTSVEMYTTEDYVGYKIGLAFEIPKNYVGLLFPRSSNSKKDLLLTNSVGVIDSGYRGEIEFRYKKTQLETEKLYEVGDRVGQIMIIPYPQIKMIEVTDLENSERGEGGFGSTGK